MTEAEERLVEKIRLFAAAIQAFGETVRGVGAAFRRFCLEVDIARTRSPRDRRRFIRDWQRLNRRPALIHQGGKPR